MFGKKIELENHTACNPELGTQIHFAQQEANMKPFMSKHTILYVDDELMNLKLFAIQYRKEYNVITTQFPAQALQIMDEQADAIDLVITDYMMPEINGFELIKQIKATYPGKHCMLLTGYLMDDVLEKEQTLNLIDYYVLKPWIKSDLDEKFDAMLSA